MKDPISKYVKEIQENHAKIIDDFVKAFIASRWEDYFSKQKKIDFRRVKLVIEQNSPTIEGKVITKYYCELKRGKL